MTGEGEAQKTVGDRPVVCQFGRRVQTFRSLRESPGRSVELKTAVSIAAPRRWVQLVAGIIAMLAIANLQYAWTFFTNPLVKHYGVTLAVVQIAFSTFVLAETWLVPFEGYLIDKVGPRLIIGVGGALVGLSWIGSGWLSPTISHLIVWYTIGGSPRATRQLQRRKQ